jgi:hypothetical protein
MRKPLNRLPEHLQKIRQRLKDDLPHYAFKCLTIRTKAGPAVPLKLNRVQLHLHERLEEQRERTGRVRALVLKFRQPGISTYIGARFYHRATHCRGTRVFILTHEQSATDTLFAMVDHFHRHCHYLLQPSTGAANARELCFDALDSGYEVGTAGTKAVGRSKTLQLFHGSEVAYWPNASTHFAGVLQAVPDLPGTEIILETTANGLGGEFHERWQRAEAGIGDYVAIFLPWFWHAEYRRPVPPGFVLDEEEAAYAALHQLDLGQMAWRRAKIAELKDPLLFKQEYPATAAEAFQSTGHDSYIKAELIMRARKLVCEGIGALVIGVDPARFGDDRFSIAWRKGRKVEKVESKSRIDTVAGANWCRQALDRDKPARMFIDAGGTGAAVYDLLVDWGYGESHGGPVRAVNFGSEPMLPTLFDSEGKEMPGPRNRRSEMWMLSRDWLNDPAGADIPDLDSLQADACGPGYHYDTNQRLLLESKEHMRARGLRSPDGWDAVALTFAEPVVPENEVKIRIVAGAGWAGW